ncbi:hypothetical protein CEUSTIGMA_g3986.t1 [Chlamydomonas eustigma]|uniref:peptidylprolyl isomerase n=1 Tax=Chlamydomonas eustigma TaxID=1157962 RepID=A0A250X1C9_9CHLO|nr:hypothetical protein CEUSTIGMA_g3986.t1 [Chlamydomonas eustigma]|eukprot:GAX76540.1 hypothetical protein CEUSTIGMA_g3986.t1 [Chlamydomonas eustigma]
MTLVLPLVTCLLCFGALTYAETTQRVQCDSTVGSWTVEVHPSWSPNGAKRYLDLVQDGFFDDSPLFRAIPGFLVQFGISMKPSMNEKWDSNIQDDPFPMQVDMKKGIMAFAGYGKHSRSTQVWIGYDDAAGLGDSPWETPFGEVIEGMSNVDNIYGGYGDKPDQEKLHSLGRKYVEENFPKLDFIKKCFLVASAVEKKQ